MESESGINKVIKNKVISQGSIEKVPTATHFLFQYDRMLNLLGNYSVSDTVGYLLSPSITTTTPHPSKYTSPNREVQGVGVGKYCTQSQAI